MLLRYLSLAVFAVSCIISTSTPCSAWLFDGGSHVGNGPRLQDETSTVWAASGFMLNSDSYATKFGMALARAYGPVDAGFTVFLSPTLYNIYGSSIAQWTLVPTSPVSQYYYAEVDVPILLRANTPYFLIAAPNSVNFAGSASYSYYGYYGYGTADYGITWRMLAMPIAARVDGTVVPEPATLAALVAGLTIFPWVRRMSPI